AHASRAHSNPYTARARDKTRIQHVGTNARGLRQARKGRLADTSSAAHLSTWLAQECHTLGSPPAPLVVLPPVTGPSNIRSALVQRSSSRLQARTSGRTSRTRACAQLVECGRAERMVPDLPMQPILPWLRLLPMEPETAVPVTLPAVLPTPAIGG